MVPVFLTKVLLKCEVRKFVGCVIGACDRWIRCCMVSRPEPRDWSDRKKLNEFFNRLLWRLHVRVLHLSCSTSLPSRDFSFFSQSEFLMPSWEVTCHFNLCEFLSWEIFLMVSFLSALFWEFPFLFGKARFISERFSCLLWRWCRALVICVFRFGPKKHIHYHKQLSERKPSHTKQTVNSQKGHPQKETLWKETLRNTLYWTHIFWIGCLRKNIYYEAIIL